MCCEKSKSFRCFLVTVILSGTLMPLLWKRLITCYLKTTFFCSLGLTLIFIIASLQEIAAFIARDVPIRSICKLTAYQIPYLLPWIIPIACFISGFQLFKSLSNNNQITLLRTSGASDFSMIFPVIACSTIIGLCNFYTCSELASICRFKSCQEIANIAVSSPSFLLQTIQKSEDGKVFISSESLSKNHFKNVLLAFRQNTEMVDLCLIKDASIDTMNDNFLANGVTLFSNLPQNLGKNDSSHILIENMEEITVPKIISTLLHNKSQSDTRTDYMPFKELIHKMSSHTDSLYKSFILETIRRISVGILCISFTFVGIVLGMEKPRFKKRSKIFYIPPILTLLLLILGKNNTTNIMGGIFFFVLPQLALWMVFPYLLLKEKKGICR